MARTRIVLVNMPRMQREILERTLAEEPDIEVVDGSAEPTALAEAAERAEAEFVIAGAGRFAPDEVSQLLDAHPGVKVLALSKSGRQGLLYELRPHRVPIGDLSSGALLETIRGSRRAGAPAPAVPADTDAIGHRR